MEQFYKSVSFPKSKSQLGETFVLKLAINLNESEIIEVLRNASSDEIRNLLDNIPCEELKISAVRENRSLNNYCIKKIKDNIEKYQNESKVNRSLFGQIHTGINIGKAQGTFQNNKDKGVYNWYPYIEGFSFDFVENIINSFSTKPKYIYDPFAGTGTTIQVVSENNILSGYSEINPLMKFIINTKIDLILSFRKRKKEYIKIINDILDQISTKQNLDFITNEKHLMLLNNGFFKKEILSKLIFIKEYIEFQKIPLRVKNLLKLSLASIIVKESNMIRRADLRYKKGSEFRIIEKDVIKLFVDRTNLMVSDLQYYDEKKVSTSNFISDNAKYIPDTFNDTFDLIITSPPYVNGTNYFRNTKLELYLLDYVDNDGDLKKLRTEAITAGINNVSSDIDKPILLDYVKPIVKYIEDDNYDKRIPRLIESYFSDMFKVFTNLYKCLKQNGNFFIDIGDSVFKNVHVPTDDIFIKIGKEVGFYLNDNISIRNRFSKNGAPLKQVLLHFIKNKNIVVSGFNEKEGLSFTTPTNLIEKNWIKFKEELPYKNAPYSKRNWGNNWHSLCSYQGKLKPAIAYHLIKEFTDKNMIVFDPLCGVGTIPFEAALQGRQSFSNDLSYVAYANTLAKLGNNDEKRCNEIIKELDNYISFDNLNIEEINSIDINFNKHISEYYHENTYRQILLARKYFQLNKVIDANDALIFSSILHILHGNRPYALSRKSHSITPFAPTGKFEDKNLIDKLKKKVERMFQTPKSDTFIIGQVYNKDFLNLGNIISNESVDVIITSPPFFDSTRFYLSNWIRLWFSGWDKRDFNINKETFLETKQKKSISIYNNFFDICYSLLKSDGAIIMHLGDSHKANMAELILPFAKNHFDVIGYFSECVKDREKFGIKDQGSVTKHQFLFLSKK